MLSAYSTEDVVGTRVELSSEESHHLLHVCRQQIGETVILFGDSRKYVAQLVDVHGHNAILEVTNVLIPPTTQSLKTYFAIPCLKSNNTEFLIEKLTELGADKITVFISERTICRDPKKINLQRFRTVALNAAKQSERFTIPEVNVSASIAESLSAFALEKHCMFSAIERMPEKKRFADFFNKVTMKEIAFVSGPEGGFTGNEKEQLSNLTVPISLGENVLRAETAPLIMIAYAMILNKSI